MSFTLTPPTPPPTGDEWTITGDRRDMNKLAFALHQFEHLAEPLKQLRDQLDRQLLGTPRKAA